MRLYHTPPPPTAIAWKGHQCVVEGFPARITVSGGQGGLDNNSGGD
jgi:hypothetical protein